MASLSGWAGSRWRQHQRRASACGCARVETGRWRAFDASEDAGADHEGAGGRNGSGERGRSGLLALHLSHTLLAHAIQQLHGRHGGRGAGWMVVRQHTEGLQQLEVKARGR